MNKILLIWFFVAGYCSVDFIKFVPNQFGEKFIGEEFPISKTVDIGYGYLKIVWFIYYWTSTVPSYSGRVFITSPVL